MSRLDGHVLMNLHIPANDNPSANRLLPVVPRRHATPPQVVKETVCGDTSTTRWRALLGGPDQDWQSPTMNKCALVYY